MVEVRFWEKVVAVNGILVLHMMTKMVFVPDLALSRLGLSRDEASSRPKVG